MRYQINDKGLYFAGKATASAKYKSFVFFPILIILICLGYRNLMDSPGIAIPCILFCVAFASYVNVYLPLVVRGKLINSMIVEIEFDNGSFKYLTSKTILYPSREVKGDLTNLEFSIIRDYEFNCDKVVLEDKNDPQLIGFIVEDFFGKYEDILLNLKPS
jgi:hypothetical protein